MLEDQTAIAIAANARQKNVAQSVRSGRDFDRIFADFFLAHDFSGELVMDLGPGQFDFARRVRDRGGIVHAIDKDPAVIELGRHLGFECFEHDFKRFEPHEYRGKYDGLFCKFSINAFWFPLDRLEVHVQGLNSMLKPGGWGWIAPWNGVNKKRELRAAEIQQRLRRQAEVFQECGWQAYDMSGFQASWYGVSGAVANHPLFIKALPPPPTRSNISVWLVRTRERVARLFNR